MTVVRRRVFPETFKREAVEKATTSGLPTGMVAAELGVHETMLRRWMAQFPTTGDFQTSYDRQPAPNLSSTLNPPSSSSDLIAENARLRAEIERLRADREILKKALAIVFEELK
jgi:transposase